jgi:hypothetical protein
MPGLAGHATLGPAAELSLAGNLEIPYVISYHFLYGSRRRRQESLNVTFYLMLHPSAFLRLPTMGQWGFFYGMLEILIDLGFIAGSYLVRDS